LFDSSTFGVIAGGQRVLDSPAGAREVFIASFGQLFASFPELEGGIKIESALLQPADDFDQLVTGFFIAQFTNRLH
jgi:hypothetical protein